MVGHLATLYGLYTTPASSYHTLVRAPGGPLVFAGMNSDFPQVPVTLVLILFSMSWNFIGDSLNDWLNPRKVA